MSRVRPSVIAGEDLVLNRDGARLVVAALELALRQAGRDGLDVRKRAGWTDVEWLLASARAVAAGNTPAAAGTAAGTAEGSFRVDLPDSAPVQEMLTTAGAANLLGVTPRAVVKRIAAGRLPATRVGREWAISEWDAPLRGGREAAMTDGDFQVTWPAGEIRAGAGQTRLTRAQVVSLVDAAQRGGKFPPSRRDHWLLEVAAGGQRGAQAITDLVRLVSADDVTRASWPGDADADDSAGALGDLYEALYPGPERSARELDRRERAREREAARFNRSQHQADNTLSLAAAPDPAASDDQLYTALFGEERT